ncbi:TPA: hypothetical protein ACNV1G_002148 [Citrobacter amalonaticus]
MKHGLIKDTVNQFRPWIVTSRALPLIFTTVRKLPAAGNHYNEFVYRAGYQALERSKAYRVSDPPEIPVR